LTLPPRIATQFVDFPKENIVLTAFGGVILFLKITGRVKTLPYAYCCIRIIIFVHYTMGSAAMQDCEVYITRNKNFFIKR